MSKQSDTEWIDDDNPEWTDDMLKQSIRFDALPISLKDKLAARGRQTLPTKISTTVCFDAEVLSAFKSTGHGWQTRMNNALKEWLREHPTA
jgi:uncharacterized protein (DUF4415 family)